MHSAMRGVPDVAYSGDVNNGLLIAWSGGVPANEGAFYLFGGTAFYDVTTGNNTVSLTDSNENAVHVTGYPATKGWDAVTGLGTPNVAHPLQFLR